MWGIWWNKTSRGTVFPKADTFRKLKAPAFLFLTFAAFATSNSFSKTLEICFQPHLCFLTLKCYTVYPITCIAWSTNPNCIPLLLKLVLSLLSTFHGDARPASAPNPCRLTIVGEGQPLLAKSHRWHLTGHQSCDQKEQDLNSWFQVCNLRSTSILVLLKEAGVV